MPSPTSSARVADAPTPGLVGTVAGVVCVVAGLLALSAVAAPWLLAATLGACAAVVAWGWAGTLGLPSPRGTATVLLVGGLALVVSVGARQEEPWLGWAPAALSLAMIATFLHQILRRDGRPRVVESVSAVVLALAVVGCGILMVPASHTAAGIGLLLGALAASAASSVSDLAIGWRALGAWLPALAMLTGGAASLGVALSLGAAPETWLLLGVASGALSHAVRAVLVWLPQLAHPRPRLVTGILSVLVVGVTPYLVGLAFMPAAFPG